MLLVWRQLLLLSARCAHIYRYAAWHYGLVARWHVRQTLPRLGVQDIKMVVAVLKQTLQCLAWTVHLLPPATEWCGQLQMHKTTEALQSDVRELGTSCCLAYT